MNQVVTTYLRGISVGEKQHYKNLTIFPLIGQDTVFIDYLLLEEALQEHKIEITEVSKSGSVSELKVFNNSAKTVLLFDGEELVGAKQNRILNTTILVAAKSVVVVPVSCVEQGRWSHQGEVFCSKERIIASSLRAIKVCQVNDTL